MSQTVAFVRGVVSLSMLVGATVLMTGCGAARNPITRCVGEECTSSGNPTMFCSRDGDCAADQFCSGGTCQPRDGARPGDACTTHNDCAVGDLCNIVTGRCVECLNEDHCDVGLVCRGNGTCGLDTGCATDADCAGLVCNTTTSTCVQCNTSGDCPDGQTCRNNSCFTSGGSDPTCQTQADCDAYGRICDLTSHTCRTCANTAECGAGKTCAGGVCTPDNGGGGGTGDGSCTTRDECGGMACFLGMCMPCLSDFMCVGIEDLLSGTSMICDPYSGACIPPQCATANDCPAGEGCYDGHCGACLDDSECRSGETCNPDTGVCAAGSSTTGCTTNANCTGGRVCLGGTCQACTASTQCTSPQTCQAGVCTTGGTTTGCGTECTDQVYTACTCGAADPCGWQADGYCDDYCATTFPTNFFDDAPDCAGGGGGATCGTECTDLYYTACTCSSADPCNWQGDGYCDDTCATEFPSDYFNDAVDC